MIINVSKMFGFKSLYLKHEGINPTGTQKDRVAKLHADVCDFFGFKRMVAASCGNFGVALSYFGSKKRLNVDIYIPESFESPRADEIIKYGGRIVRIDKSYEECVRISRKIAEESNLYDANPGTKNSILEYWGYRSILDEIIKEVNNLTHLALPVSNGVTLSALAFNAKIMSYPIVFVVGSCLSNPIAISIEESRDYEPLPDLIQKETVINEPLINWDSLDGINAVRSVRNSGGFAVRFSDDDLKELSDYLNSKLEISSHPAAVAGLLAVLTKRDFFNDNSKIVCLITSRNY